MLCITTFQRAHMFEMAPPAAGCVFGHATNIKHLATTKIKPSRCCCVSHGFARMFPPERIIVTAWTKIKAIFFVRVAGVKYPYHISIKTLSSLYFINGNSRALQFNNGATREHSICSVVFTIFRHEYFKGSAKCF